MIDLKDITASNLVWNRQNRGHIRKHDLNERQVEQIFQDSNRMLIEGKLARFMLIGRCGRRILSVVLAPEGKKYILVTARDASREERIFYRDNLQHNREKQ